MKKKTTPKSNTPIPNPRHVFPYIIFGLSMAIALGVVAVLVLFVLIKFTSVKNISGNEVSSVNFSYFLKRPDLLSSSKALIVYDTGSHVPLLSKNQSLRFSPASTAKMMTALIALEHYRPETILTVGNLSENADSSRMGLYVGEKMSVLNLLYGMLLPSGSDAADVLADNYPGGEAAFVSRMNERASSLGLSNTHFVDPSGYSDDNYSTAYDLARLGAYALRNDVLRDIVKTKKIIVYNADRTIAHNLENLNELLDIPNVTGVKTGFTNEAEGVLVTSYVKNGRTYVIVVLGSKDRFADTRQLIEGIIRDLKSEKHSN